MKAFGTNFLNQLTRRRLLAALLDLIIVFFAYYLIVVFRYEGSIPEKTSLGSPDFSIFIIAAIVLHLGFNAVFHVYSIVTRYVGLSQAKWIVNATVASIVTLVVVDLVVPASSGRLVPLTVVVVGGCATGVAMTAVRFYSRVFQTRSLKPVSATRILLVGAGNAADVLIRQIEQNPSLKLKIIGAVDDDPTLHGMRIHDYPILGSIADAPKFAADRDAEEFFIAIPSASSEQMEQIYQKLKPAGLPIKTLPPLSELMHGSVDVADVHELNIDDLLGRSPVQTDLGAIAGYLKDRRVLVTGAAGSIGSELCRQIARFHPQCLIMVDRNESGLYELHEELRSGEFRCYSLVPTHIQQRLKMRLVFEEHRPEVVFHAAAFKHVPLMEAYPDEAVLNNVVGTQIVAQEAGAAGVKRFVNISTDKAADPVSAMGASKAVAELVVRDTAQDYPNTRFCSVRFGNVLGSRGSVIPIFQSQIAAGGPLTVTHPDMTRYVMSIPEAVQLVMQAASLLDGADNDGVFILDMGEPVRILDIAKKMIMLTANGDSPHIDITFTGLRPGEKMNELLVGRQEHAVPTSHSMVTLVRPASNGEGSPAEGPDARADFRGKLASLVELAQHHADRESVIAGFRSILPTYEPFTFHEASYFPVNGSADSLVT